MLPLDRDFPDSAMLQMQAAVLGVTHPTGYPTYLMLAHLFKNLPVGDVAYRVNLASAVFAALAVLAVYAAGYLITRRMVPAAAGALTFGLGTAVLISRDRAVAALTGFLFLGWFVHALENNIPDVQLFFIPIYLILYLWMATGLNGVFKAAEDAIGRLRGSWRV